MVRRTRSSRRSSTSPQRSSDVSEERNSTTSEKERLDADSRGIHGGLQTGEGDKKEGRRDKKASVGGSQEQYSNAERVQGINGQTGSEVVYETDEVRLLRESVPGGYLYIREYFTRDIFRNRKHIEHVTMAYLPR